MTQSADVVKAYYTTPLGDSITGWLHLGFSSNEALQFRRDNSSEWNTLRPNEIIQAVSTDGQICFLHHEMKKGENDLSFFAQRVVYGYYSLYRANSDPSTVSFFIQKQKGALMWVNPRALRPQLETYFGDCSSGLPANLHHTEKSLTGVIQLMNQCIQPEVQSYTLSRKMIQHRWGGGAHFWAAQGKQFVWRNRWNNFSVVSGGLSMHYRFIPMARIDAGINYLTTPLYQDSLLHLIKRTEIVYLPGGGYYTNKWTYHYKYQVRAITSKIELPVGLTLTFEPHRKINFSCGVGGLIQWVIKSKTTPESVTPYRMQDTYSNYVPLDDKWEPVVIQPLPKPNEPGFGFYSAIQANYALSFRRQLSFGAFYYDIKQKIGYWGYPDAIVYQKRVQFTASYYYFFGNRLFKKSNKEK